MREMQQLQMGNGEEGAWRIVRCVSLWLEADDYPLLLGTSFHASVWVHLAFDRVLS